MRLITLLIAQLILLTACGPTYEVPKSDESTVTRAAMIFEEERQKAASGAYKKHSPSAAAAQYNRVVRRVEPVAEEFCRRQTASKPSFNCDVRILYESRSAERNAFQTYGPNNEPLIVFTIPMIADVQNEDELAFAIGHEFGHHIAAHIEKQRQQELAGALAMGIITAYAQSGSSYYGGYNSAYAQQEIQQNMELGAQIGQQAYSQTYELEADVLGTYISRAAGYDPVKGARFFARPEAAKSSSGKLSFWGTHPPNEKRLATVITISDRIGQ